MIRCMASDLDGTLLRDDRTISQENREAINQALQHGIKVMLASGRMIKAIRPFFDQLGLDLPVIAYNGAVVQEPLSGKVLAQHPIDPQLAANVVAIFREARVHLNLYQRDELYMDEQSEWGRKYAAMNAVKPHLVPDLAAVITEPPPKLLGIADLDTIDRMETLLKQRFGDALTLTRSLPNHLEIVAPGVSKAAALAELTGQWDIKPEEVMAIGDGPNDLPMLHWAGIGVAVGNAAPEVKAEANWVVADNNHNGVAEALNRAMLR